MFKKGELQLLWPFYLDALISPLLFFLPAFSTVYFLSIGLSLFQIGIILGVRPAFSLLFEVPTGAIADIYGRKASVLLSFILAAIGYFALFFFTDFYALVIIFAFLGFASTFYSGAGQAWVVDLIKSSKKDFIKGYFAKTQALDHFALIFSGILGGILVKLFGLSVIFLFAGGSYVLAFIFSLFAKEVYKKSSVEKSIVMQTKKSINYARKHHVLYYLLIAGAILSFAGTLVASLSQTPLLLSLGFQEHWFGYFWSMLAIFGIFANIASARFLSKWDDKLVIVGTVFLSALMFVLIPFLNILYAVIVLLTSAFFIDELRVPSERSYFHKFIPSKLRSTIGSVESMTISVVGLLSFPLAGYLVDNIGAQYTILSGGLLMIVAGFVYAYSGKD